MTLTKTLVCSSCHIGIGPHLIETALVEFRGEKICSWCFFHWQKMERNLDRIITFAEFTQGVNDEPNPHSSATSPER